VPSAPGFFDDAEGGSRIAQDCGTPAVSCRSTNTPADSLRNRATVTNFPRLRRRPSFRISQPCSARQEMPATRVGREPGFFRSSLQPGSRLSYDCKHRRNLAPLIIKAASDRSVRSLLDTVRRSSGSMIHSRNIGVQLNRFDRVAAGAGVEQAYALPTSFTCLLGLHRPSLTSIARAAAGYQSICGRCARRMERPHEGRWTVSEPLHQRAA
jgi:hypothetical protein